MKNYWLRKLGDCAVMLVLALLLFWVLFPSLVTAASPEVGGWVPYWTSESGVESVIDNMGDIDILYPFV